MEWLSALRDPELFAEHTDPVAALCSGFAHELAGNIAVARERYLEMNRRFNEMEKIGGGIRSFKEGWRDFIFVRDKLGLEDELTKEIRQLANWNATVQPLTAE